MIVKRSGARIEGLLLASLKLLFAGLFVAFAQPVFAQSTFTYVAANDGAINSGTSCTSPLVRNFTVTDNFTVADVDLGFFATHTWRGDIRITLQSPNGTRVQLVNGDPNGTNGDNINVLLDDDENVVVNTVDTTLPHSTANPPPFANPRRPNSLLSAFNGGPSAGTWRLEICDLFPSADNGNFRHAELYLTAQLTNFADLSLTKTLIGSPPVQGGTATWRLTVTNDAGSPQSASNIVVTDTFPGGFTFANSGGDGSFNSANGQWSVGTLAPGQSAILTVTGAIGSAAGSTITNTAQITASSIADIDSTVNNGVTTEDDYALSSFVVQSGRAPGVPPILSCPAGASVFDWDNISGWTPGTLSNSYGFDSFGNIDFSLTNDGVFLNSGNFGGQTPTVVDYYTGGLSTPENSLHMLSNQPNQSGVVAVTITLPRSFVGLQFSIFDVDFQANQFADRLEIIGSNGGVNVMPVLTNGNVNEVNGNVVIGDGASSETQALGNVVVTFTQPVDTIVVLYGNHTTAPVDPGQQGIGLHDITVCNPFTTLSVSKVSSIIADPVNGTVNPKAIPRATVDYLITVTNTGNEPTDADTVMVWDDGPADAKMCLMARSGGPVIFSDPGGNSGLTYDYGGTGDVALDLGVGTDDLEFSRDNGGTFVHTPVSDADGCDELITDFRVRPAGALASGESFTLRVRYQIK